MYVNKIIDPRGPLELASRDELYRHAKAHNVTEVTEAMYMGPYAAEKMRKILTARGLTNLKTTLKPFGVPEGGEEPSGKSMTLDDLINEPTPTINHSVMSRAELAKECKRRGIKMQRTDTKEKLQERLSVAYAA